VACIGTCTRFRFSDKRVKRLLKPTGTLIVAVPNFKSFDAKHGAFWAAYDVPFIFWHFSKMQLKCFCKRKKCFKKCFQ
jgi:hypothetical protein